MSCTITVKGIVYIQDLETKDIGWQINNLLMSFNVEMTIQYISKI